MSTKEDGANAFTESLAHELVPFGVRAHLAAPGRAAETAFGTNARTRMGMDVPEAYRDLAGRVIVVFEQAT